MQHLSAMAIAAHADDIELLCGGTLAKFMTLHSYEVHYVMSTNNMSGDWCKTEPDGSLKVHHVPWKEMMVLRHREADAAAREIYHTAAVHLNHPQRHYKNEHLEKVDLCFGAPPPDGMEQNIPTILTAPENPVCVNQLTELILEKKPQVIFTHAAVDPNPEHTCTAWLVINAVQGARRKGFSGSLLLSVGRHSAECAVSYGKGDTYIDISGEWLDMKIRALGIHRSQSAGIFAEHCCEDCRENGKKLGISAAESFLVHSLNPENKDPLTMELQLHLGQCR